MLFKQAYKFILHLHIVSIGEFPHQCIRSHTEELADCVADAGQNFFG